jgi:hypothetical protein
LKSLSVAIGAACLILVCLSPARGQSLYGYDQWSETADTLLNVTEGERIDLRHGFIVPGSESLFSGAVQLQKEHYEINYRLGVVRIYAPLGAENQIVVRYRRAPFVLDPVYSLREAEISEPATGDTVVVGSVPAGNKTEFGAGNLLFGGTKSISFTVGNNRGTSLDQSLQASIEGQLTPTIRVKALLSDNNLPVQPEGNTEELEYLDQVYVEIEGSNARTMLGDFGFENNVSTFSPFTRQLKGISAQAWKNRGKVTVAGAESKGEFRTVQFRGTTGLQGPYELLSATRYSGEVVIAGTERVYLDGRRLDRGQNRDYTIDYDVGTLTFTPRVLVTNDSEIAVDFEVTQQRYDRSTLFTAGQAGFIPGGMDFDVVFARERDDRDSPKNQTFSDEDVETLREAGDDPTKALVPGDTFVGAGEGDYILVPADTVAGIAEHYEFNDSIGDYDLSFVEVGPGSGDYEVGGVSISGTRFFRFTGEGNGNYRVGRALPLPESVSLVTARLRRQRGDHVRLDAEWNVSEYDRNLFSAVDDGDNTGEAGQFRLGIEKIGIGFGYLGIAGSFNTINDRFKSFDRSRPAYFYRDWNLENVALSGRETLQEYEAGFERGDNAALKYKLGRIDRPDVVGKKQEGTFRLGRDEDRVVTGRAFDTNTDGTGDSRSREHATVTAAFGLWRIRPSAVYSHEKYHVDAVAQSDSGIAYDLYRVRLGDRSDGGVSAAVQFENRDTREIVADSLSAGGDWRDSRRDRTATAELGVRGRGGLQGELQVTHREVENFLNGSTQSTDLARLKGFARSGRAGLRGDVDYEISQTAARLLTRSVVFVGEGEGDYNAQGDLVGKGLGAFALVYSPTANTIPTNRVSFNFRLVWKHPGSGSGFGAGLVRKGESGGGVWSWIKSNVTLDQTISVVEESTYDPAWKVYLMVPSALQRDSTTVYGSMILRQDWSLLESYRSTSLTFRFERRDEEDNRFEGISEQRFFGSHLVRLSRSVSSGLTLTGELSRTIQRRDGTGLAASTGGAYDVTALAALGGIGLRSGGGSSADIDLKLTEQDDAVSSAQQVLLTLRPKLTWRITRIISVFGSYDVTRVWNRNDTATRPIVFSREGDSHRWNITPTVRLSRYISLVAGYNGRRETVFSGNRITDHELKIETRAFF